jgi:hypothetical protein
MQDLWDIIEGPTRQIMDIEGKEMQRREFKYDTFFNTL